MTAAPVPNEAVSCNARDTTWTAVACMLATGLLVWLGILLSARITPLSIPNYLPRDETAGLTRQVLLASDGKNYYTIAASGYRPVHNSNEGTVVFFPGYPCLAWMLSMTGMDLIVSLAVVSWVMLFGALILLGRYACARTLKCPDLIVAAAALNPMTFYLRFCYPESTFLALSILLVLLIQQQRHPLLVSLCAGAMTGVRSAGVAAIPVAMLYAMESQPTTWRRIRAQCLNLPVAVWGLLAFMLVLYVQDGNPWAFIDGQRGFVHRSPRNEWEHVTALATLEPLRRVYSPQSSMYWNAFQAYPSGALSVRFATPIVWIATVMLVIEGMRRRWLNKYEALLAIGQIGFAYWFQAYRTTMESQGRYMAVVFPAYLVAGRLLGGLPKPLRLALALAAGGLMLCYVAAFARHYDV